MKTPTYSLISSRQAPQLRAFFQQYPQPPRKFSNQLMRLVIAHPVNVGLIIWILLNLFLFAYTLNDPNLGSRRQAAYLFSLGISITVFAIAFIGGMVNEAWTLRYGAYI